MLTIIALTCGLIAPLGFADPTTRRWVESHGGCLTLLIAIPVLWVGSSIMAFPTGLLVTHDRAALSHQWAPWLGIAAAPLVAWGLTRFLSPFKTPRRTLLFRTALLLVAVVATERLAISAGVPVDTRVGPASIIAFVTSTTCVACWRLTDRFYRPLRLLVIATIALAFGTWQLVAHVHAIYPDPRAATGIAQLTALLQIAVCTVAAYGTCVGAWRMIHWLRHGPRPSPLTMRDWPPLAGEIWNAWVTHDDGGGKDRPVLVWNSWKPGNRSVDVLKITSVNKSDKPRYFLHLPLSDWHGVLSKESWLSLETTSVDCAQFRNKRGSCVDKTWERVVDIDHTTGLSRDNRAPAAASPWRRMRSTLAALW